MDGNELGVRISAISVVINTLMCIFKLTAGFVGRSTAMVADGVHSLSDTFATIVVIIGLKISAKGADEEHPYGHEKFEPVFAKLISIVLVITGVLIGYEGIMSLVRGHIMTLGIIALIAAVVSIVVKEGMYWYTIIIAKKIRSLSMEADAWHHRSDAFSSVGTFIGILGARMGYHFLDPVAGIAVSFFIIKVGVDFYIRATRELVDQSTDKETIEKIKNMALLTPGVRNVKELKTRIFGNKVYVDIEIFVDRNLSVKEGHDIAESVHDGIEGKIQNIKHCMVHVEPFEG